MRFRFCGDLDCPDWVLAEISILSRITSIKMKLLCTQIIMDMIGESIIYEKVYKLTSDAKYETSDVKAAIAAIGFIISNAIKYQVDADSLCNELQQLGLPKENAASLCRSYQDKKSVLEKKFRSQSLQLSKLDSIEWRVDYTLSASDLLEVNEPCVQLKLNIRNSEKEIDPKTFTVGANKFRIFLYEMKQNLKLMESI